MSEGPLEAVPQEGKTVEIQGTEVKPEIKKPTAEELSQTLEALGLQVRELIVLTKRLPATAGLGPHQDAVRSIALAQSHLQTGFMWLRRAIEQPNVF